MLYTDGFVEAADPCGEPMGEDRLAAVVREAHTQGVTVDELVRRLFERVDTWTCGQPVGDDLTLVVLTVLMEDGSEIRCAGAAGETQN